VRSLLPCMRCGGLTELHENDWADPPLWSWRCPVCFLSGREFLTRDEAIADANLQPRWTLGRICRLFVGLAIALTGAIFAVLMLLPPGGR
jgi:hypothetical protein